MPHTPILNLVAAAVGLAALLCAVPAMCTADLQQWSVPRIDPASGAIVGTFSLAVNQPTTFVLHVDTCGGPSTHVHVSGPSPADSGWMPSTLTLPKGVHRFNYTSVPARPFGASKIRARAMGAAEAAAWHAQPFRVVQGIARDGAAGPLLASELCTATGDDREVAALTTDNWMRAMDVVRKEALGRRADKVQVAIRGWNGAQGDLAVQVTRSSAIVTARDPALPMTHVLCQHKDAAPTGQVSSSTSPADSINTHLAVHAKPGHWQAHCMACMRMGKVPAVVTSAELTEAANAVRLALETGRADTSDVSDVAAGASASLRVWIGGWDAVPAAGGARPLVLDVPHVHGARALVVPGSPEDLLPYLCQD